MSESQDAKKKDSEKGATPAAQQPAAVQSNRSVIIAIIVSAVAALALCIATGVLALTAFHHPMQAAKQFNEPDMRRSVHDGTNGGPGREGLFGMRGEGSSNTRVNGVITSISGDSFVVAGNGKTVNVTKSGSTSVRGTSASIAVNDTVMILGTQDGDSFTATTIIVRNITSN